jgi:membrane associated rhomboid family serine protease
MNSYHPLDPVKQFFSRKSALSVLILINIAVFLAANLFGIVLWLLKLSPTDNNSALSLISVWFGVPAYIPALLLKPWTIITYMFVQEDFMHILFNMMVLFFGGQLFTSFFNEKKLVSTYLLGGISGALLYILFYNVFPVFFESLPGSVAIGASAAVLSILVASATYAPDMEVGLILLGRVKLKYIALFLVIIDVFSIRQGNAGGHIAHLGGALWGFIYIRFLLNTYRNSGIGNFNFNKFFASFRRKKKPFQKTHVNSRPLKDDEYNKIKVEKQERIDEILDKIAKSGYEKLSKDEKEFLFNSNKK